LITHTGKHVGLKADLHSAIDDTMLPNNKSMKPADVSTTFFKISQQGIK
jgi:hypothetical protein